MTTHALRGMNDIFPPDISLWVEIEQKAREIFRRYRYEEIRTPILEEAALFTRTIGETTNIVEKEMYLFQDRNGKWVTLRPEGTASVIRAYIEHKVFAEEPVARYFYLGPMYRYERPQKGRFRQFYQMGAEVLGVSSPFLDAEVIRMTGLFFEELGLTGIDLEINSLGCPFCRPKFLRAFLDFLLKNEKDLCPDCRRRMERNPLRALDCRQEGCLKLTADAPSIQDHLCESCEKDFDSVLGTLGHLGSRYKINPKIVRGLDYYQKTTFEFVSSKPDLLGSQNAVAGGGRYDGLVHLLGGPNVAGFGFAIGMERLVDLIREGRVAGAATAGAATSGVAEKKRGGVFLATLGEKALAAGMRLAAELRAGGVVTDMDYEGKSLKSQMRRADRIAARHVVILGEDELAKKKLILKDLATGGQEEVPFDPPEILIGKTQGHRY